MVQSNKFSDDKQSDAASSACGFVAPLVEAVEATAAGLFVVDNAVAIPVTSNNEEQPLLYGSPTSYQAQRADYDNEVLLQRHQQQQGQGQNEEPLTEDEQKERSRKVGAGIFTGLVGTLFCGPIIGVLLGFGAAYAATKEGALGDSARALGDVALVAGAKAKEVDEKHHVVERTKEAAGQCWEKAKEMDRQHDILDKAKDFVVFCAVSVRDFCVRNRVIERGAEAADRAAKWAEEKISQQHQNNIDNRSGGNTVAPRIQ